MRSAVSMQPSWSPASTWAKARWPSKTATSLQLLPSTCSQRASAAFRSSTPGYGPCSSSSSPAPLSAAPQSAEALHWPSSQHAAPSSQQPSSSSAFIASSLRLSCSISATMWATLPSANAVVGCSSPRLLLNSSSASPSICAVLWLSVKRSSTMSAFRSSARPARGARASPPAFAVRTASSANLRLVSALPAVFATSAEQISALQMSTASSVWRAAFSSGAASSQLTSWPEMLRRFLQASSESCASMASTADWPSSLTSAAAARRRLSWALEKSEAA
mmetsp:Transcript_15623/g.61055  ORF Transcript_15623/g.61055 Transcript_15623/m.61055 type:complete len:277 (+) Transcript_15623:2283-3113(+)